MYSSRKTKILNIVCVLLVLTTGVIRLTRASYRSVSSNTLIFFLFILSARSDKEKSDPPGREKIS